MIEKSSQGEKKTGDSAMENEFGAASVSSRGGLRIVKKASIKTQRQSKSTSVADIAISGIPGWIQLSCETNEKSTRPINVLIEAPVGIEAFVRPPMPTYP